MWTFGFRKVQVMSTSREKGKLRVHWRSYNSSGKVTQGSVALIPKTAIRNDPKHIRCNSYFVIYILPNVSEVDSCISPQQDHLYWMEYNFCVTVISKTKFCSE
jgi:hypothetical protein